MLLMLHGLTLFEKTTSCAETAEPVEMLFGM